MPRKFGKADFCQLEKLAKNIEKAAIPKSKESVVQVFIDILFESANLVVTATKDLTPVGVQTGGQLRRNWFVGNIIRKGDQLEIEVYNSLEYASYVEYGHRGVAIWIKDVGWRVLHTEKHWTEGRFMLTLSMREVEKLMPKIADRHVQKFLKELVKI